MADIGNIKNFFVTWYDESDNYATTADITDDVLSASFTDTGSGQVNECILKLSGNFGNFITDKGSKEVIDQYDRFLVECEDLSGNQYRHFFEFIPMATPSQSKSEGTWLELDLVGTEHHTQRINYAARHWFANGFDIAEDIGDNYNDNKEDNQPLLLGHTFVYDQGSGIGNGFPQFNVDHYEYGIVEETGYNRWNQMLDKYGGSVANGGVLDFFELGFETPTVNTIQLALFSSGSRTIDLDDDGNLPIIIQSQAVNVGSTDVGIAAATATQVASWGAQNFGTLPTGSSIYRSGVDQFIYRPVWKTEVAIESGYLKDAKVQHLSKHYISLVDDNNQTPGNPSFWQQIDMSDEFGDDIQYSEWTDDKVREWANCGANPSAVSVTTGVVISIIISDHGSGYTSAPTVTISGDGSGATATATVDGGQITSITVDTGGSGYTTTSVSITGGGGTDGAAFATLDQTLTSTGACMFDANIVILDNTPEAKFFRTFVDGRISNSAGKSIQDVADRWAYNQDTDLFPIATRIFIDGVASGFTGNDSNGIPFENNIAEWTGDEWLVKYRPTTTDVDLNTMQVVVLDEAQVYTYDADANTWSILGGDLYSDCIHKYDTLEPSESYDPKSTRTNSTSYPAVTKDGQTFTTNIDSAIKVSYKVTQNFQDRLLAGSADVLGEYFSGGGWLVWRVPFSRTNDGTSVSVGNIYGTADPQPGAKNLKPSTLDKQNMTWTSRGTRGFNQDNSQDLGNLQELTGRMTVISKTLVNTDLDGINRLRCWAIDRFDNTVYYDVEIPFVNFSFPFTIPLDSFQPYRGRQPRYFQRSGNVSLTELIPQELENANTFQWREVMMIGFQLQGFYDEFDRYAPDIVGDLQDFNIDNVSLSKIFGSEISLILDDFNFSKPLLAIARQPDTKRNLEAEPKQRPHIITYNQLLNDAQAELEKEQFQTKEYQLEIAGTELFKLRFGDAFFFENDLLVNNEDDTSFGNEDKKRIKLVAKHIQYNLTSPGFGDGGMTATITSGKRFE